MIDCSDCMNFKTVRARKFAENYPEVSGLVLEDAKKSNMMVFFCALDRARRTVYKAARSTMKKCVHFNDVNGKKEE